ncbi:LOB domain-containing protein 38 [Linum grandiflorum]
MSCNGCRVLRKGCSETCILRPCLQWIDSPESQGHATVFVAKFFGRAGLMSFISAVPDSQRPALFQSLLFEACGRTVNPVNGAVGLLWTGNWHVCQTAVETVLRGGSLRAMPELLVAGSGSADQASDEASEVGVGCSDMWKLADNKDLISPSSNNNHCRFSSSRSKVSPKRKRTEQPPAMMMMTTRTSDLDLRLTPTISPKAVPMYKPEVRRHGSPSMNSEESGTTTCLDSSAAPGVWRNGDVQYGGGGGGGEKKLLSLFV